LDVADVDLASGVLAVRESKFGKSRFVPVEASTRAALATYSQRRDEIRAHRETAAFLVSGRGTRLGSSAARRTFAKLCQATGLRPKFATRLAQQGIELPAGLFKSG
jgi:site-specific recombinase XerD